jgi:hypothetical protein
MRIVQNDFCEKNGPNLPYFEGDAGETVEIAIFKG